MAKILFITYIFKRIAFGHFYTINSHDSHDPEKSLNFDASLKKALNLVGSLKKSICIGCMNLLGFFLLPGI